MRKLYSEMGKGTTFKLYLPRHFGADEEEESQGAELGEELRAEDGEVVLVLEDETAVRALVMDVLEELGYKALEAVDGPSALKILDSKRRIVECHVLEVAQRRMPGAKIVHDGLRTLRPQKVQRDEHIVALRAEQGRTLRNLKLKPIRRDIPTTSGVDDFTRKIA